MNKKNIAIAMSGLTVLASAAPVFANVVTGSEGYTVSQKDYKKAVKQIQDGIKKNIITSINIYFDGTKVSTVTVAGDQNARDKIADDFNNTVEGKLDSLGDGKYVDFEISYNKGIEEYTKTELENYKKLLDNKVVIPKASGVNAGAVKEKSGSANEAEAADNDIKGSDLYNTTVEADTTNGGYKLSITAKTISNVKYGTIGAGNYATAKAITATGTDALVKGKTVDISASYALEASTGNVSGLSLTDTNPGSDSVNVRIINAKEITIDLDASSYDSAESLAKKYVFKPSTLTSIYTDIEAGNIDRVNGKYQVEIFADGKRLNTLSAVNSTIADPDSTAKVIIKADKLKDLKDYVDDLKTYNNGYSNSTNVSGDDRIETAIALSEKYYNSDDDNALFEKEVNSVVLVGSNAIVDGLVASPLAAEKKAPLLLTSKDKLDSNVKSEIKRVMNLKNTVGVNSSKKVYLAGGVNSISKDVENELKDMGLKVTRLAGDDRYATSLEIADEIGLDNDKAFVVGGTGLADAMSIAPVASKLESGEATPIVVVDGKAKTLSSDASDFLGNAQVDIIGGENSVSKDVERDIDDATGKSPERVSGDDRQATNAEVIKNSDYYEKGKVKNFFLAKDGSTKEDQLVDALAAAAVAGNFGTKFDVAGGETSPAPIVLATDSLSSDQSVAISKALGDNDGENLVQVGKGIATSVVTKLKDLLNM
ncbi:TPA: S-layer protein SlpA [Clostridioides difficile]|uniref:S-layer protein SlpA n=1 Tax=Clostridioides difficile TaxID=1496 RepID=UPI00017F5C7D|nr:S-layer protein SlpA [Clostridioides difficile]MCI9915289.1 S-layer protein SlpA [Clostridioides difficile]MDV9570363.1 S-layer protein SlpA [Clostridioides difficile]MDV9584022.1 S-layer protein SlpA [Clostridioides difficile]MDV9611041.1 S-layer protein SlpA [Clostridioides difficile]MDV9622847.1 S-layer protein SlpA [Clostridioides difficile]